MSIEAMKQLREVHAIQGRDGCWNIDDYMLGLYNGLELALSIMENRECVYKYRPEASPPQRQWVGLTDEDKKQIAKEANYNWEMTTGEYAERIGRLTEAKLKEKNT